MTSTESLPGPGAGGSPASAESPDAELLTAARHGSDGAFAVLYSRYRGYALAVARRSLSSHDPHLAEDVAEIAFTRVLRALRNGNGPTDTMRHYLATSVRREAWRVERRRRRQSEMADQLAAIEAPGLGESVTTSQYSAGSLDSHALLSRAFAAITDRWRHVLWLTEIEGRQPAEVGPMLGISAQSAAALAYRARRGLVSNYFAAYGEATRSEACRAIVGRLEDYLLSGRDREAFPDAVAHLEGCPHCRDLDRGIDVLGESLVALLPLAVVSAGLWIQATAPPSVPSGAGVPASPQLHGTETDAAAAPEQAATPPATRAVVIAAVIGAVIAGAVLLQSMWPQDTSMPGAARRPDLGPRSAPDEPDGPAPAAVSDGGPTTAPW